jgi:uncharacterized membrane protein
LLWVPPRASLAIGLAIIFGEAAIAQLEPGHGPLGTLLALATQSRDFEPIPGYHFFVSYPPIPWFGVMAFGYGLADRVYGPGARRAWLVGLGAAFLALFAIVRGGNSLDPSPWSAQPGGGFTVLSFLNLSKYPPSTPFLLLTLGGAMLVVAAFERWPAAGRHLETYGKVPLFFYLIHVPLIHLLAVGYAYAAFGAATWLTSGPVIFWDHALPGSPPSYGFSLAGVWLIWAAFIVALYPACRWFGNRARRRPSSDARTTRGAADPRTGAGGE